MREINFRAWYKKEKKMYEVDEICFECDKVKLKGLKSTKEEKVPIADVELMQYIGFNDKNAKEVCEGDIVDYMAGANPEQFGVNAIVYEEVFARFSLEFDTHIPKDDYGADFYLCGLEPDDILEIIGNVYENPDLLNTKEVN